MNFSSEFLNVEMIARTEQMEKLKSVSDEDYSEIIPEEMSLEKLNKINYKIFGAETLDIYLNRNIIDAKTILITDFSDNGFFWGQIQKEAQSSEFRDLFDYINNSDLNSRRPCADGKKRWCIAEYQGEWFRAYIDKVIDNRKLKVFFLDYGTIETVDISSTRQADDENIWEVEPLAIPFIVRNMPFTKFTKFKKFQYSVFHIISMRLIENNYIFEVDLADENGTPLLDVLS